MVVYTYLIRNNDLYNIGFTDNLNNKLKKLRPTEVLAVLETENSNDVFKRLTRRYLDKQLPESQYYRLSKVEAEDCKRFLVKSGPSSRFRFLGGANIFVVLTWWLSLSGLICWYGVRPLFGGKLF